MKPDYRVPCKMALTVTDQHISDWAARAVKLDYETVDSDFVADCIADDYCTELAEGILDTPAADSYLWDIAEDINAELAEWRKLWAEDEADRMAIEAWLQSQQA